MNYSRSDLLNYEATMNQMRNAIYQLARFMAKNNVSDIENRLKKMGQNIALTFVKYWKPTEVINTLNVKDVISTIYKKLFNSSVSVEVDNEQKLIIVKDYKCSLCKYKFEDIEVAGCEILVGMVSEMISSINRGSKDPSTIFLEPNKVLESKSYGNKLCVQSFKYIIGGG